MKTFKSFLAEQVKISTREQVESIIASYKNASEILNPDYQNLAQRANNILSRYSELAKKPVWDYFRDLRQYDEVTDLDYGWGIGLSLNGLSTFEKKLDKIKKTKYPAEVSGVVKKIVSVADNILSDWKQISIDMKALKLKVVKVTVKRQQEKEVKTEILKGKFRDSSSLIKVLESHLEEYKERARTESTKFVKSKLDALAAKNWDLSVVAPRPNSNNSREEYMRAIARRSIYELLTDSKDKTPRSTSDVRVVRELGVAKYIKDSVDGAEQSYREFMQKMIEKIGKPVVTAKFLGNIWTGSVLDVVTNDGESQRWNTKMIINFSKYQKMFNQFPTTRKK
jgi:Arc/MetJ-type ribon-helix-helix transcriptional regulator